MDLVATCWLARGVAMATLAVPSSLHPHPTKMLAQRREEIDRTRRTTVLTKHRRRLHP